MIYILDGNAFTSRENAHAHMAEVLHFPEHYGANLDALWDCLTEFEGDIVLCNVEPMLFSLGSYAAKLLKTFYDAERANRQMHFSVENSQDVQ